MTDETSARLSDIIYKLTVECLDNIRQDGEQELEKIVAKIDTIITLYLALQTVLENRIKGS